MLTGDNLIAIELETDKPVASHCVLTLQAGDDFFGVGLGTDKSCSGDSRSGGFEESDEADILVECLAQDKEITEMANHKQKDQTLVSQKIPRSQT